MQVNTGSQEVFVYPDRKHGLGIPGNLTAKFVPANWISWNIHRMETVHSQPLCLAGRQQRRSTSCSKVCPARWETLTGSGDYVDDSDVLLSLLVHPAVVRGKRNRTRLRCYLNYSYYLCKSKQLLLFTFALLINLFSKKNKKIEICKEGIEKSCWLMLRFNLNMFKSWSILCNKKCKKRINLDRRLKGQSRLYLSLRTLN